MLKNNEIQIGWYAFEGEKFSPDPKAYPNCQGVVAWLNSEGNFVSGKCGLIIIPESVRTIFSKAKIEIGTDENDGMLNTKKLVGYGKENGDVLSAAEWCVSYQKNGINRGEVFLPAKNQLGDMAANVKIINQALAKIGGDILADWIMSSTEYSAAKVWCLEAENAYMLRENKSYYFYAHGVKAF